MLQNIPQPVIVDTLRRLQLFLCIEREKYFGIIEIEQRKLLQLGLNIYQI